MAVLFTQTLAGALMAAFGGGVIATFCVPFEVQPFAVTVTLSVVVPDGPAVKAMPLPVVALVMVPFVIDHAYVAPATGATLALRPVVFGHAYAGALRVTGAAAVVATVCVPLLEQPLTLTVMPRITLPEGPASKVMAFVFVALVIVPLVIVQP